MSIIKKLYKITHFFGLLSWVSESILDTLLLNKIGEWLNVN